MDEIWERAVETALDGQTDVASVQTLTLDSAVKCVHGRLPPPSLFEKFQNLQHLSIANIGVSSLEQFPRLRNLQKLILSDNRIAGGLEFLVEAGLESLRDLDLSNNRISEINDLRPLAELRLVSLDLYECPVTRVKDYRSLVFGLIRSLRYLDKIDADGNERPESDEEEEEEEDDEEEEEDDPGSGEIDGDDHRIRLLSNGNGARSDGVLEADEDEESDADEEETETSRGVNGSSKVGSSHHHSNGFRAEVEDGEDEEDEEYEGEEYDDSVDEVDEDDNEDVVEVHEIESDDEEDGVEDDDGEDGDEDEEEVDNDEIGFEEPESNGRLTSTEGEIDGHEQGEEDADEDDDGETGEEELALGEVGVFDDEEDPEDEEEDNGNGYLIQPVGRAEADAGGSVIRDVDDGDEDPEIEEDIEDDEDGEVQEMPPYSSSHKRKRDDEDSDDSSTEDSEDEDIVEPSNSSKRR